MPRAYAKPRFPTSPRELGAALADPLTFAELFPDAGPDSWAAFEASYSENCPAVAERIELGKQQALQAANASAGPPGIALAPESRKPGRLYNKRAPGARMDTAPLAGEFPLARAFWALNKKNESEAGVRIRAQLADQTHQILNALSERIPAEGGFLLPENLRSELLELALEQSIIRPRARIVPMDSLRVPFPAIDDTSHETSVYGGVQGFWTAEGATLTASAPSFARLVLEARKLTMYTTIPNELLQDASELLEMWLRTSWPAAIAWFEDLAMINGTGTGEPEGFLNAPGAVKVATSTAHVIELSDVISQYVRILPQCLTSDSLIWLCSPDTKGALLQMASSGTFSGTTTPISPPAWLAGMNAIGAAPSTLFGHPLIVSEKMPSSTSSNTTTAGALTLIDLGMYLLGDRQTLQSAVSEEYLFGSDLVAYRMIERCDGRLWVRTPLQPYNAGPTLSPCVLLDTTS